MMILYGPITIMLSVRILFFKNFRFDSKIPAFKNFETKESLACLRSLSPTFIHVIQRCLLRMTCNGPFWTEHFVKLSSNTVFYASFGINVSM